MNGIHPSLVNGLKSICGPRAVLSDPASLLGYENDGLAFHRYLPDCVVIPANSNELQRVIRFCRDKDFPCTIRGAGTSLSGGPVAVQGGLVIHVSRLQNILQINQDDFYCVVEPGVVLNRLNRELEQYGLFYPPDPSSGASCTIGGNVAENAGGIRCFKYGVTAHYVLGLEIILADGEVVTLGGPAGGQGPGKGSDWCSLHIGSEGLLGVISKVWLRLKPLPEKVWTFLAAFNDMEQAMRAVVKLTTSPVTPVALEFMDNRVIRLVENSNFAAGMDRECCYLLVEIDGPADLVDLQTLSVEQLLGESGARDVKSTSEQEERMNLWKARKVFGGLLGQLSPERMSQDAVVPSSRISEVLSYIYAEADSAGIPCLSVVHAGDGNIHPNFLFDGNNREEIARVDGLSGKLMQKAVSCDGMITGEHGVGNDKLKYIPLVFSERDIAFQKAVLKCFNPDHRLNPGKVFSGRSFHKNGRHAGKIQTPRPDADGFEPFYDPENSVICVDASVTTEELHVRTKPDGLYFPLCLDETGALGSQMRLQPYTSCSFRYGPWADNVLGMNFRVGEKTVRVGSRTIKNAAGFELVRFLCNSGSRFGSAERLVLRLRPVAERTQTWKLTGSFESLDTFRKAFLKDPWANSADAFDFEMDGNGSGLFLTFSFSVGQEGAINAQLMRYCDAFGLSASVAAELPEYATRPAARVKAPLSQTLPAARELVRNHGGRACGYLGNGFFQYQPPPDSAVEDVTAGLQVLHDRLSVDGGHVDADGLRYEGNGKESSWERILKEEWFRLP